MSQPRAVIYARISLSLDGDTQGIDRQERECRELADKLGVIVVKVFSDNNISGSKGKKRPAYEEMLASLPGVDYLLAWDESRLTRRPIELERLISSLEASSVTVATVNGGEYGLDNSDGRLRARILGSVAASESEKMSARQKSKHREKAARGDWPSGKKPMGYDKAGELIPVEAKIIADAAKRYLGGEALASIVRRMEEQGLGPRESKHLTTASVRHLLKSPLIAGHRNFHGEILSGNWEPIIDLPMHYQLVERFENQRMPQKSGSYKRLLTGGLIYCGNCDHAMHARQDARKTGPVYGYGCENKPAASKFGCGKMTVVAAPVDALVVALAQHRIDQFNWSSSESEQTVRLETALAQIAAQERELATMFGEGSITADMMTAALKPINARKTEIMEGKTDLGPIERPIQQLADMSMHEQRAIINRLVTKVRIHPIEKRSRYFNPDRVEIIWNLESNA